MGHGGQFQKSRDRGGVVRFVLSGHTTLSFRWLVQRFLAKALDAVGGKDPEQKGQWGWDEGGRWTWFLLDREGRRTGRTTGPPSLFPLPWVVQYRPMTCRVKAAEKLRGPSVEDQIGRAHV